MSADQTEYDVFISYSRKDNRPIPETYPCGWVTAIRDHIAADHRQFSTSPLRLFFDTQEIKDADDWRHRILGALTNSKILLVCLSPNYFASEYCVWEWEEYLRRQVHRLMGSDSVATIYFVEVPCGAEQATAARLGELMRGNYTDLRPWFPEGAEALQKEEVRQRMARLGETLWERLERARRAMAVPGNLRWQNPHFVGRREELRSLHEQLGLGSLGVVTAVHGLGGQGKTELAIAYAHSFADCYPAGLWSLGAEGKTELLPLIGELAWERALGFTPTEAEKADPALLGRGVLDHLKTRAAAVAADDPDRGAATLLLLDNVSDPALLSAAQLATLPGGMGSGWLRIVATTRLDLRTEKNRLALLPVDALDEESALALIRDHQPPRDAERRIVPDLSQGHPQFASEAEEDAARSIVRDLGGFTLAVEQVALYLGLHSEVAPSAFLASLRQRGLPAADDLPAHDPNLAAQMLTQTKQLSLILDSTLARLDATARTAIEIAARLPPDCVPWPWLRELTEKEHPELRRQDAFGADPWETVRRRLVGMRLLTPGDDPAIARIHRLVAVHLHDSSRWELDDFSFTVASGIMTHLMLVTASIGPTNLWELDALSLALPPLLSWLPHPDVVASIGPLSEKLKAYRGLGAATNLVVSCHKHFEDFAERSSPSSKQAGDYAASLGRLGELALARGDLVNGSRYLEESHNIRADLVGNDPENLQWQFDLSTSHDRLGRLAGSQGNLTESQRHYEASHAICVVLAEADPSDNARQRDLARSFNTLGDIATARGDLDEAKRYFAECNAIRYFIDYSLEAEGESESDAMSSYLRCGDIAAEVGDQKTALQFFTKCLSISREMVAKDSANIRWQRRLSVALERLAQIAAAQCDLQKAENCLTESLSIVEDLAARDPTNVESQSDLAGTHYNLIAFAYAKNDAAMMIAEARACLAILESMKRRGMHLDPQSEGIHSRLSKFFSGQVS